MGFSGFLFHLYKSKFSFKSSLKITKWDFEIGGFSFWASVGISAGKKLLGKPNDLIIGKPLRSRIRLKKVSPKLPWQTLRYECLPPSSRATSRKSLRNFPACSLSIQLGQPSSRKKFLPNSSKAKPKSRRSSRPASRFSRSIPSNSNDSDNNKDCESEEAFFSKASSSCSNLTLS